MSGGVQPRHAQEIARWDVGSNVGFYEGVEADAGEYRHARQRRFVERERLHDVDVRRLTALLKVSAVEGIVRECRAAHFEFEHCGTKCPCAQSRVRHGGHREPAGTLSRNPKCSIPIHPANRDGCRRLIPNQRRQRKGRAP